jgi:hypothetical protein
MSQVLPPANHTYLHLRQACDTGVFHSNLQINLWFTVWDNRSSRRCWVKTEDIFGSQNFGERLLLAKDTIKHTSVHQMALTIILTQR